MKKLATFFLIISFMNLQLHATELLAEAKALHSQGQTLHAMEERLTDHDSFNFLAAVEYVQGIQKELAWAGIETDLSAAVKEVMQILVNMGTFTVQELELAQQFYEQFIQKNPAYALPVKIPVGLVLMLAGVLISLAPGSQVVGASLTTTGSTLVVQGFVQWEQSIIHS